METREVALFMNPGILPHSPPTHAHTPEGEFRNLVYSNSARRSYIGYLLVCKNLPQNLWHKNNKRLLFYCFVDHQYEWFWLRGPS